jgi:hypothetical protein
LDLIQYLLTDFRYVGGENINSKILVLALAQVTLATLLVIPIISVNSDDILQFPSNDYTEQTLEVITSTGQINATYHLYRHIAYVANPVDVNYESLDVAVPVTINGEARDATNAPILLIVNNPGYTASANTATGLGRIPNDINGKLALGQVVLWFVLAFEVGIY